MRHVQNQNRGGQEVLSEVRLPEECMPHVWQEHGCYSERIQGTGCCWTEVHTEVKSLDDFMRLEIPFTAAGQAKGVGVGVTGNHGNGVCIK